jgi:hypothetical protein
LDVFLLWHVHELNDGEEDGKLVGVYSSHQRAEQAKMRALALPDFREVPDGFITPARKKVKNTNPTRQRGFPSIPLAGASG